jgi:hypothetical protein
MDPDHKLFDETHLNREAQSEYWFALADKDGNGRLDGHEILMSMTDGVDVEHRLPVSQVRLCIWILELRFDRVCSRLGDGTCS